MDAYKTISEIVRDDSGEVVVPLEEWEIEVVERGLSENLGDLGSRKPVEANVRVRVTEADGTSWTGLAAIEK